MIRMINGSTLIGGMLVSAGSAPFEADPQTEANLVIRGAAEYCDGALPCEAGAVDIPGVIDEALIPEIPGELAETVDMDALSAAELRALCDERGIEYKKNASAKALKALLEDFAEDGIMPELHAADPVDA